MELTVSKLSCHWPLMRGRCHSTTDPSQTNGVTQAPITGVPHLIATLVWKRSRPRSIPIWGASRAIWLQPWPMLRMLAFSPGIG